MSTYLYVYFAAAGMALVATPLVIRLAKLLKVMDTPGVRKVHSRPTPRMGGAAIAAATFAGAGAMLLDADMRAGFAGSFASLATLLAAGLAMFVTGLIDDIRGLRPRLKLMVHLAAAGALCASGARIENLLLYDGSTLGLGWASWPLTIVWIVGMANAINLIDGLDGLAAGIAAAACGVLAITASWRGEALAAGLLLATLGGISGFLVFNVRPAKIFLGDSGTYFIGFMLGGLSVISSGRPTRIDALAVAVLAMGVPVLDLAFSVVRRTLQRRSIFAPDRGHIHHQLLESGLGHAQAVVVLYAATLAAGGLAVWMAHDDGSNKPMIFGSGILLLMVLFARVGAVRLRESLAAFRRNLHVSRQTRQDKRAFEDAQLRLRETTDFWGWWQATCQAAGDLGFRSISLQLTGRSGRAQTLAWQRQADPEGEFSLMQMTLPIHDRRAGAVLWAKMEVYVNGSLELAGRRAALFDRLMEELGPSSLPTLAGRNAMPQADVLGRAEQARGSLVRVWRRRGKRPETEIS